MLPVHSSRAGTRRVKVFSLLDARKFDDKNKRHGLFKVFWLSVAALSKLTFLLVIAIVFLFPSTQLTMIAGTVEWTRYLQVKSLTLSGGFIGE